MRSHFTCCSVGTGPYGAGASEACNADAAHNTPKHAAFSKFLLNILAIYMKPSGFARKKLRRSHARENRYSTARQCVGTACRTRGRSGTRPRGNLNRARSRSRASRTRLGRGRACAMRFMYMPNAGRTDISGHIHRVIYHDRSIGRAGFRTAQLFVELGYFCTQSCNFIIFAFDGEPFFMLVVYTESQK